MRRTKIHTFLALSVVCVASALISGCQTAPQIQIRYQTVPILPPDDLITNCKIEPPPQVADYMALKTWSDKEGALVQNDAANIENLGVCNIQWTNLRKWKTESAAAAASAASNVAK